MVLSNTYVGFLKSVPKYVLGTRNMYWVYVLGNTPYVLDNTFSYVLGNKNVTQYIYPVYILRYPIYMIAFQYIYPIYIYNILGNTPYVLDNTFSYVLGNKNVTQYIYPVYILRYPIYMIAFQYIYPIYIYNILGNTYILEYTFSYVLDNEVYILGNI